MPLLRFTARITFEIAKKNILAKTCVGINSGSRMWNTKHRMSVCKVGSFYVSSFLGHQASFSIKGTFSARKIILFPNNLDSHWGYMKGTMSSEQDKWPLRQQCLIKRNILKFLQSKIRAALIFIICTLYISGADGRM